MMAEIFFDTSALYAALLSPKGAARELVRMALSGSVKLYISQDVIVEATRNLSNKAPELVAALENLVDLKLFVMTPDLNPDEVQAVARFVEPKDAMIVAAAMKANVAYLATFDRKHLIDPTHVSAESGLIIGTPGEILQRVRA